MKCISPECHTCGSRLKNELLELESSVTSAISGMKQTSLYKRGSVIYENGQYPYGVYCVHHGHVKITRTGPDGRENIIRFAKIGDIVGYASLLNNERYQTNCVAVDDSIICCIPAPILFQAIRSNHKLSLHVMQRLSSEVQDAQRRIVEIAHKTIKERVAETLLILKEVFGVHEDGLTLKSPLTREEIAAAVGTAPESVIRTLSDFKADKLIATQGRSIQITNIKGLARIANIYD